MWCPPALDVYTWNSTLEAYKSFHFTETNVCPKLESNSKSVTSMFLFFVIIKYSEYKLGEEKKKVRIKFEVPSYY